MNGKLAAALHLKALADLRDLCGLGPIDQLRGEVTIADSRPALASVAPDGRVTKNFAAIFCLARTPARDRNHDPGRNPIFRTRRALCSAGNRAFVHDHPVATKRALRAILKAADFCAAYPERAARHLVDRGFTTRYDYAVETMRDVVYDIWRDYDAEYTLRFYALRVRDAGFVKSTPQKIIADGTDCRFLNEVKRELKA